MAFVVGSIATSVTPLGNIHNRTHATQHNYEQSRAEHSTQFFSRTPNIFPNVFCVFIGYIDSATYTGISVGRFVYTSCVCLYDHCTFIEGQTIIILQHRFVHIDSLIHDDIEQK